MPTIKEIRKYKLGAKLSLPKPKTINLVKSGVFKVVAPAPRVLVSDKISVNPMYANNKWGDCVIAERAHHTRRFEVFEQNQVIDGTDGEVLYEYWHEQGWLGGWCNKPDNGLDMLSSITSWRKNGWTFAGKKYNIYAFGTFNWQDPQELANIIYYLNGAAIAVALPVSAQAQTGGVWDIDNGPNGTPASWGYHAIYMRQQYNMDTNLWECVTWGATQKMTTAFVQRYFVEGWGIVDNRDNWVANSPVDVVALDKILAEITA